ncbi:MAG: UDP-galactopyranose mutase [Spirochaetaceae bacterium]|nr:UDP-galactopyranose mutase [Spirochaetaceae bacterium]
MKKHYDYIIVGTGLFGAVFAHEMMSKNKSCLMIEKRPHIGGNVYSETRDGINIHLYGAHIFHTSNEMVWKYINQFTNFNNYINSPLANYKGKLYNLPFNMNTFYTMWGAKTPNEVKKIIDQQKSEITGEITNLEQQAISLVGRDIFEKLIKGYTEKQWGSRCCDLPPSIIKRIPVRYTFDNNYFNHRYQGIPEGGYLPIIMKLIEGADVILNTDFNKDREKYFALGDKVLYTGTLDSLYDFSEGELEYRSEKFEHIKYDEENHQGVAVINYTDIEIPYTRTIEHKHFEFQESPVTWVSYEYPCDYSETGEPYYPLQNEINMELHKKYVEKASSNNSLLIGGRLAEYCYYDMDKTIESALILVESLS